MTAYDFWYHVLSGIGKVVAGVGGTAVFMVGMFGILAPDQFLEVVKRLTRRR